MLNTILLIFATSLITYFLAKQFGPKTFILGSSVLTGAFIYYATKLPYALEGNTLYASHKWIKELDLHLHFYLNSFSLSFALLALGAGALILFYSAFYFDSDDPSTARFGALFIAFSGAMLGLVTSENLYLLFIFWEITTVLSFLLIGHHNTLKAARSAALQSLIVTTLGGLAMLIGIVTLHIYSGSASLFEAISAAPQIGAYGSVGIYLIALGAITKSAIFPFHFWLPGAMAAPTPVSAYLHAAAMVKAGVIAIALLAPVANDIPYFTIVIVTLGGITMLLGAIKALRQTDIKLLVAHSTVSQLGMLFMLLALAQPKIETAAIALVFSHAISKAPIFLIVGIVDKQLGTRDLQLVFKSKNIQPILKLLALFSAFSLAGVPITIGFLAKESALTALVEGSSARIFLLALIIFIVGSALTAAYMFRFLWAVVGHPKNITLETHNTAFDKKNYRFMLLPTAIFAVSAVVGGMLGPKLNGWLNSATLFPDEIAHLKLWHGFTVELLITLIIVLAGITVGLLSLWADKRIPLVPEKYSAANAYWKIMHWLDLLAVRVTVLTQRGTLHTYLAIALLFFSAVTLLTFDFSQRPSNTVLWQNVFEIPIFLVIVIAAFRAARVKTRFQSVILVGVTGYAIVGFFLLYGAPDLAITQGLVETVTLITFILVIRRLPRTIETVTSAKNRVLRIVISAAGALAIGAVTLVVLDARSSPKISDAFEELAVLYGHGLNIVNVTLVDIRGWDTMGELSVVIAAATGVASLIFIQSRGDNLPKLSRSVARKNARSHLLKVVDPNDETRKTEWILSGAQLDPDRRSIILEVVIRLIFHSLIIVSIFLLFAGHNAPGGGFAGGLVAGLALIARYLAGGRHELGATITIDAGKLLGLGLALATLTPLIPLFFGQEVFTSSWFELNLGILGELTFVTSSIFDIGVYFVVLGLTLDVLRSLGAEIDIEEENELESELLGVQK